MLHPYIGLYRGSVASYAHTNLGSWYMYAVVGRGACASVGGEGGDTQRDN